ncbi:IS30 family transposase [Loigolactobacillus coryniformis]|uniref:IS30 family transposase n=1 Tax=Loigolactobacillus coryniformis TaxID=1610 RepID=A0A5B8TFV8_9LACO|nr:IS30 family transposase [Loigolactobacillus coryniformis]QEA53397.1 IS30 family transposase [Loigolactobacillus coryniformis]
MTQFKDTIKQSYKQLSGEERGQIQSLYEEHCSIRTIAKRLSRSPSTISREIKRGTVTQMSSYGGFTEYYFADTSQIRYEQRRLKCHRKSMLEHNPEFFKQLAIALKTKFRVHSVDSFVATYKRDHPDEYCPATPTVYRYIDQGLLAVANIDLPQKVRRHAKYGSGHVHKNKKILGDSIEQRPAVANDRSEFGHWEGDLVKGKRTSDQPALLTLTERMTRYEAVIRIPNYQAATCKTVVQQFVDKFDAAVVKSLTFDNGSEFASLNEVTGTHLYFAHPYTPSERGSNEHLNGLLREFIPKGRSIGDFSDEYIKQMTAALNQRPRKIFGYKSANEFLAEQLLA